MQRLTPIFAVTLAFATGTLLAQTDGGGVPGAAQPTASPSPTESPGATDFFAELNKGAALNFIHHLNNVEIQQAQQALSRGQSEQLRQFAQALIDDHSANENRLQELANQEDVFLSGFQPSTYDQALSNALVNLPSAQFDQIFAQLSAQEHAAAIQDLQRMNAQVSDPEVQAYITQKVTELQAHQQQATALASGAVQPSPSPSPTGTGQQPGQAGDDGSTSGEEESDRI